ncbi:transcription initiation factor TFIID subunit 12 isoform X2 [Magnolia sinica]|uniref:transcription initiation factor TFIID subunit 12 isoform X2 n=1 Tax=Magnolia sinica TaxID=86752 RepID=UPI0026581325|nr:transcription initiation factor TFIID subunit 12 isoform X2 [Magnolia sinica]
MGRGPSMGSPSSSSPGTPPSSQPQSQPWMSSAQGKVHQPSLPSPQYRPHLRPQTFQQRPHLPQQHQHPLQTTSHPIPASQQQQHLSSQSHQSQEHFGQQYPPPRAQQPVQHQHQPMRPPALASQKSISPGTVQPGMVQSGPTTMMGSTDAAESGNQILSKRSIHDLVTQKFQGHGMGRITSMGSPSSPSLGTPPGSQPLSQPWMSSAQGKMHQPSLPSTPYRPHMRPQTFQQRPHLQSHPLPTTSHPQQMPTSQQQQHQSHQSQEHYGQQFPSLRAQQPVQHQHQPMRPPVLAGQKSIALGSMQPSMAQLGPTTMMSSTDAAESGNQILSKRSIHELVTQIDPSEKLDPEVEDVLVEIAEDFVESITTVACSLAKHRKSTTLEAKDILLHLERNWNMTLPGFSGDEIKSCKKPFMNDIHKERLAAVKKSIVGTDAGNTKASAGQPTASTKGHAAKAPTTGGESME